MHVCFVQHLRAPCLPRHQTFITVTLSPPNPTCRGIRVQARKSNTLFESVSHQLFHDPRTSLVLDYVLNSVSAIINLPVTPFMGAAREGWGHYFRNLHGKMRPPGEPNCEEQWLGPSRRSISTAKRQKRRRTRHRPYSPSPIIATASTKPTTDRNSPQRDYRRRRKDDSNDAPLSRERSQAKAEQEQRIMENDMIRRMAARLQFLWQELKIPRPDRTYIVVMYLAGRFAGAANEPGKLSGRTSAWNKSANREEVQRELTRQTTLLLAYRIATIKV